jgi:hypothetical protein
MYMRSFFSFKEAVTQARFFSKSDDLSLASSIATIFLSVFQLMITATAATGSDNQLAIVPKAVQNVSLSRGKGTRILLATCGEELGHYLMAGIDTPQLV